MKIDVEFAPARTPVDLSVINTGETFIFVHDRLVERPAIWLRVSFATSDKIEAVALHSGALLTFSPTAQVIRVSTKLSVIRDW